jgi:hypothetical protein
LQRIQYHRYGGPEEMRLETDELAALGEYVHDQRAVPARHRHGFLRRPGSIGSTEGRVHPHVAYVLAQGDIALDHQRFVEASGGGQGELTI